MAPYLFFVPDYTNSKYLLLFQQAMAACKDASGNFSVDDFITELAGAVNEDQAAWIEPIEKCIKLHSENLKVQVKYLYLIVRFIVTGRTVGGPFLDTLRLLGPTVVLQRLRAFRLENLI